MSTKTTMTFAEFAKSGPETDGYEFVRGELVTMPPQKGLHGEICINVGHILKNYQKMLGKGCVVGNDAGLVTQTDPDTVRGMDVGFFLNPPWSGRAPNRYFTEPPDLVVEVRSDGQTWADLVEKVNEYLHVGVRMVWIADPKTDRLTVFERNREPATFAVENEFDGGEILPALQFPVRDIFQP